jgi:phosphoglycerate dehydrogenase-like enzyme
VAGRPRCAVLNDYQRVAASSADWGRLADRVDITYFDEAFADEGAAADALAGFAIAVAMRERTAFPATLLSRLPDLKLLVTAGSRNAVIDVAAAQAGGVTVCGTTMVGTPTADLTWGLIIALARHLPLEAAGLRSGGPWQRTVGTDLAGATLGVLGLGGLGSMVATVGRAFGMDVVAWSHHLTDDRCAEVDVRRADSLSALLRASDFVSIHLILSKRTRGLIGAAELAAMKPTAYLINTARGPIVDEAALIDALAVGRIAGAGLDVFDIEPLPVDHPFRTLPNVLATPHLGYVTSRGYEAIYADAIDDIAAYLDGAPIRVIER